MKLCQDRSRSSREAGAIARAARQAFLAQIDHQRRFRERARFRKAVALTDALVRDLEELNLAGRSRLTNVFRRRLADTMAALPDASGSCYRDTVLVQRALDQVFVAQELLLRDRRPAGLADDEDGESERYDLVNAS
ncbi:MAG: hypothetical protein ACYDAY_07325 [Candidatus Dormibacteria bacterium]